MIKKQENHFYKYPNYRINGNQYRLGEKRIAESTSKLVQNDEDKVGIKVSLIRLYEDIFSESNPKTFL